MSESSSSGKGLGWLLFCGLMFLVFYATKGCVEDKEVEINDPQTLETVNVMFRPFGLFNKDEMKNPQVQYRISTGNVVWSVIFCETIIVPVYLVGWYLYEPVGPKEKEKSSPFKGAKGYIVPTESTNRGIDLKIRF